MIQEANIFIKRWASISLGVNVLAVGVGAAVVLGRYEALLVGGLGALFLVLRCFLKISRDRTVRDFSQASAWLMVIAITVLSVALILASWLKISVVSAIVVLTLTMMEMASGLILYFSKYKIPKRIKKGK